MEEGRRGSKCPFLARGRGEGLAEDTVLFVPFPETLRSDEERKSRIGTRVRARSLSVPPFPLPLPPLHLAIKSIIAKIIYVPP